ncbi:MAG: 2-oxoacid:acceptor oxidoreductase family protein [Chloroflexota bacterium]
MIKLRFHGRGGQGTVLAVETLAYALLLDGKYAQSMPRFGAERRGAPVMAFMRVDDRMINERGAVNDPDCVVVLDTAMLRIAPVTQGLKEGGWLIVNSSLPPEKLKVEGKFRVATVDANAIALKHGLGTAAAPVINTVLLGAVARVTGLVSLESLKEAIRNKIPTKKEDNATAAEEAFKAVKTREAVRS